MKSADVNTTLIDGYIKLLSNLSPSNKLDLISKLSLSVKSDITDKKKAFKKAFGAFGSVKTAEEINNELRSSKTFDRKIETF